MGFEVVTNADSSCGGRTPAGPSSQVVHCDWSNGLSALVGSGGGGACVGASARRDVMSSVRVAICDSRSASSLYSSLKDMSHGGWDGGDCTLGP